jgi:C terminal of Calcineurin-like phosphoesterase/N terminal of Calcineurin-like phosphoesterase/Calcineurin-like phosphoesterase
MKLTPPRFLCVALAGLLAMQVSAQGCYSRVYADNNANNRFDAGDAGVRNVAVSDGVHIVRSDRNGLYRLAAKPARSLFVIKPSGYSLPKRDDGLPDFFANQASAVTGLRYGGVAQSDSSCRSFALLPKAARNAEDRLSVLLMGDPQPKSAIDVDYYRKDIIEPLIGNVDARLAISLGDIVHDDLSLLPAVKRADSALNLPWLYAAGNHDIDFDATDDAGSLESFRRQFGPDTFAWEEPQANFVVLDNVIYMPGQKPNYTGGLRERQFHFLARYLAGADKQKLLVMAMHMPLFETGAKSFNADDRARLFKLLAPFRDILLLTAHNHEQSHFLYGQNTGWHGQGRLREYNAGAACGGYWAGPKDAAGIPDALMSDGTPNGFARLEIEGADYRLRWFNARNVPDAAMSLHAPQVLRQGSYPGVALYANVFMAREDAVVEVRINNGPWQAMQRVLQADPRVLARNLADDAALQLNAYDRTPEASVSRHLWRFWLPTHMPVGEYSMEVRATDLWLGEVRARAQYRLQQAKP